MHLQSTNLQQKWANHLYNRYHSDTALNRKKIKFIGHILYKALIITDTMFKVNTLEFLLNIVNIT